MLKVLELFGGIGACTAALKRLKTVPFEVVDYVEIDKYAVKSYNAMNGTNFEPQDICEWDKDVNVDLVMHGSPCQDFSIAGKQAGGDKGSGTRSSLLYETLRIVKKLKPKYIIWENVPNILSDKHIKHVVNYRNFLNEIGYENYTYKLNAKYFGVPQNRDRVFVISIRKDIQYDNFSIDEPYDECPLCLNDILENDVDDKYYLNEDYHERYKKSKLKMNGEIHITGSTVGAGVGTNSRHWVHETDGIVGALSATDYKQPKQIVVQLGNLYGTDKEKNPVAGRVYSPDGIAPTLRTPTGGNAQPIIELNFKLRKLTPKEYWRLMGFTDDEFNKAAEFNSNTQLYRQAGNSIVVNVLEVILKELLSTRR